MDSFVLSDLSIIQWIMVFLSGMLIGMAKGGIAGLGMLAVVFMAFVFGGKQSTGLLLPMLSFADLFAVIYYHRSARWDFIIKLMPWALLGIGIALYIGDIIPDKLFKSSIGILVLFGLLLMLWKEIKKENFHVPDNWYFAAGSGLLGGFATMIGNAAGPIMAIYLLSMKLPKNSYIGTAAWFFMIVNLVKIPLHVFFWKTVNTDTFFFNLNFVPAILIGFILGVFLVKKIPDTSYRFFIMFVTAVSSIVLFIK